MGDGVVLTCVPNVRSLDCNLRANASARPRQDIPIGSRDDSPQGLSLPVASPGSLIYCLSVIENINKIKSPDFFF